MAHVPAPDAESDEALRLSLQRYGQLTPLIRRSGTLVDGHRRAAVLKKLKMAPWVVDLGGSDGSASDPSMSDFLGRSFLEINACRRELPLAVRAAMADALATRRKGDNQHSKSNAAGMTREEAAKTVGVSADTLDRYRHIKGHPRMCARVLRGDVSLQQAVRLVQAEKLATQARAQVDERRDVRFDITRLEKAPHRFSVVLADPPWDYGEAHRTSTAKASPARHYPTMPLEAIKALRVDALAARDAVLWLWTPNCQIPNALEVMRSWGFTYVTCAVWVKPHAAPTSGSVRPGHETLLVAKRGQGLVFDGKPVLSVFQGGVPGRVHSRKPTWFVAQLDRLYPNTAKVELFGRQQRPGWTVLGNQDHDVVPAPPVASRP